MSLPKRAPHIVLGAPTRSDRNQLAAAFAKASRRVKTGGAHPFSMTDLTAALAAAEGSRSPNSNFSLMYTIPADPGVVDGSGSRSVGGRGVGHGDDLLSIDVERLSGADREALSRISLVRAMHDLFEWKWEDALLHARLSLRISRDERVRDEALNLLAASHFAVGDHERAIQALMKAVEGDWNPGLQGNLALVAWDTQPEIAVRHMSFVIGDKERLNVSQRLEAAELAISLWRESQAAATGSTDDDDDHAAPSPDLVEGVASLMLDSGIEEEQFYRLGIFVARFSPSSVSQRGNLAKSRHMGTVSGDLIRARSAGFGDYMERLVQVGGQVEPGRRPWIDKDIEDFVLAIASWFRDDGDKEHVRLAVSRTFDFMKHGLRLTTYYRVYIVGQMIRHLDDVLDAESAPADEFVTWWRLGRTSIAVLPSDELEKGREFLDELFVVAGNVLAFVHHRSLLSVASTAEQRVNEIARIRWKSNEARALLQTIVAWCREAEETYRNVVPLASNQELRSEMTNIAKAIAAMRGRVERM